MQLRKDNFYNKNCLQFNRDNQNVNFFSFRVCNAKESQVHCIRCRQFRPFQICLHYFNAISGFIVQPKLLNPGYTLENPEK